MQILKKRVLRNISFFITGNLNGYDAVRYKKKAKKEQFLNLFR